MCMTVHSLLYICYMLHTLWLLCNTSILNNLKYHFEIERHTNARRYIIFFYKASTTFLKHVHVSMNKIVMRFQNSVQFSPRSAPVEKPGLVWHI